ncbi:response regulator transcription factor [Arenibacter sp. ARW7G5Y1]|uniref:response regulator transcription factor n=1 Tax=Arenibacter sp. ARW7G5Y1 TaxID=2135619 RepID=UPI000D76D3DC|nr:response regulator transcription factor [Arenibacter sp. ARW7G5Y1]PXX26043.1 DNA-binding response OmpR family regulator [Arenibacter sp. ARW7G5Y1]
MKLLIIEDEQEVQDDLIEFLKGENFLCEAVSTASMAKEKVYMHEYDAIILDIGLPDGSGLEVLEYLKKINKNTGVIVLSAHGAIDDKISALNIGADDYLTKPFDFNELNARIKSIIRRKQFHGNNTIDFGDIKINTVSHEVAVNNKNITLTQKEYQMLLYFISNENRVITKESIVEHLWGDDTDMFDSFDFIYGHIKNLRKKIVNAGGNDYLSTIYGVGYKFQKV